MTEIGTSVARFSVDIPNHPDARLVLAWGAATDTGRRRAHNEDSFIAEAPMFAVADGMGGHSAGDLASAAVVSRLFEAVTGSDSGLFTDAETIERGLRAATGDISQVTDEKQLGVGTTVTGVALALQDDEPFWMVFNVGDSRVYRYEGDALLQVTVDHSVVQELVDAGVIRAEDAETHPDSNVITRAVGFNIESIPDYWVVPVSEGIRLLLCSDGLTKELASEDIRRHLAAGLPPAQTAIALVDAAVERGGRDNITTIVIDVLESSGFGEPENTVPRTAPIPIQTG
ncbi:protein phosphatase 2C domain-containing protein [Frigoribacterium sp. CG_9.8]|uniref:PP2C family protein-serine/threonine phosphatase n=1 Tax=Frigoribacterium sp. CG_9.8 TaxID=2787733 RepID=UPI0018CAD694|nr:protein phosphatase [Frigoribacterium sp. CG_9.8]